MSFKRRFWIVCDQHGAFLPERLVPWCEVPIFGAAPFLAVKRLRAGLSGCPVCASTSEQPTGVPGAFGQDHGIRRRREVHGGKFVAWRCGFKPRPLRIPSPKSGDAENVGSELVGAGIGIGTSAP